MSEKQIKAPRPLSIEETYAQRPRRWWVYTLIVLVVALILFWSASGVQYKGIANKGSEVAQGIVRGLASPNWDLLLGRITENTTTTKILGITVSTEGVPYLLFQTIAIAFLGTIIGGLLAVPISFLACDRVVPKWVAKIFQLLILLIRTIPSLVWALVWIRVTGPNAFCGVVTQSVCSIGMISKMYITAIEDLDVRILESLDASGCNGFQKIRCGILPQIIPNFISTVIYRFDINMKDATTLGIVGAGGIGAPLIQCITSSRWSMVGSYLFGLIILMMLIEWVSTKIRNRLTRG
ncbi:MAG: ABC transporter permease subunit [Clostridia bacterium]|jgi:phosphonate transport system permease protein|nr:ABC transporter permease subunit [Clostridia bacterium]MBQ2461373.1 ABC transporter permease subunit [Clostridia bacterium]MBQ9288776.1 ABC transporter permease subunit [Clostridia bacterium]MBR0217102.1 ABC transporter permease subunit [Clostridia bacterium]